MPILPEDFNVITMFQEKANRKIKTDIKTFYATNKDNLNNRCPTIEFIPFIISPLVPH